MKKNYFAACLAAAAIFYGTPHAQAASAYIVDDAGIVDPDTVQSESWFSHTDKGENTGVVNLHYQPLPHVEVVLQETHDTQSGTGTNNTISPQIKYQWLKDDDAGITSGLIVGSDYIANQRRVPDFSAYVPVTVNATDKLDVNLNLGWEYIRESRENFATWGAGTEYHFTPEVSLVDNVFGFNRGNPGVQIGPRVNVSDNIQLDFIYGYNVVGQSENMMTAGLTVNF